MPRSSGTGDADDREITAASGFPEAIEGMLSGSCTAIGFAPMEESILA